jgi:hypothetical protein
MLPTSRPNLTFLGRVDNPLDMVNILPNLVHFVQDFLYLDKTVSSAPLIIDREIEQTNLY